MSKPTPKKPSSTEERLQLLERQLDAWLDRNNARCLWSTRHGDRDRTSFSLHAYAVGSGVAIVQRFDSGGFEIYTPGGDISTAGTFIDAANRLGGRS